MPLTINNRPWVVHSDTEVKGFFDEPQQYRWLSNFWPVEVWFEGLRYQSSEAAFQAQKVSRPLRVDFTQMGAGTAKRKWKDYPLLHDDHTWNLIRVDIMTAIVFEKFYRHIDLRSKLLATGSRYLEETNDWNDVFWGADPVLGGKNQLGKILMLIRTFWNNHHIECVK